MDGALAACAAQLIERQRLSWYGYNTSREGPPVCARGRVHVHECVQSANEANLRGLLSQGQAKGTVRVNGAGERLGSVNPSHSVTRHYRRVIFIR